MMRGRPRWTPSSRFLGALAVAALAVGVYANTLQNGFAFDDTEIIVDNPGVHDIEHLDELVLSSYWPGAPPATALYRPLTVATYAVDWALWNGHPRGFHAVNVLLHAGVALLVFALLLELGVGTAGATLGGAIFAVHPVHVEAVANVVGRAELLAALFFLTACLLYLRRGVPPWLRVPGLAVCYFLALASKEHAVMLPAVLLLLEAARPADTPGHETRFRDRLRAESPGYVCLAAAAAAYAALRWNVLGVPLGAGTAPELDTLSTAARLATVVRIWPEYARLLFFPLELVADYGPAVILPVDRLTTQGSLGLALGAIVLATAVAAWRRAPLISVAVLWFAITILPVSNILVLVGVMLAERTLYLPSVAIALAAGALARYTRRDQPHRRTVLAALALLALTAGAVRTWTRNPVWKSTQTVVRDLFRHHPESFRAQWILGRLLIDDGKTEAGLHLYRRAAALVPSHYSLNIQFGLRLLNAGRPVEAETVLQRARARFPQVAEPYILLSQSLLNQKRPRDALRMIEDGLAHAPPAVGLYHQKALAHAALGEWDAAFRARVQAMAMSGIRDEDFEVSWVAWYRVASIHFQQGRNAAAAWALDRARERAPAGVRDTLTLERVAPWLRSAQ
ncbi:MAG TPA: tetratricopeptide repeat protein [Longimicrobiales bacterium]